MQVPEMLQRGDDQLCEAENGRMEILVRFPKEITDEQDVEGGLGSSQGPKEKWTCWLRAEPPAKAVSVHSRLAFPGTEWET